MGLVDAGVEDHFGGPLGDLLGRHLGQQDDRVVVDLAPLDRIEIAEQVDDLGVPAPPEIAGQGHAPVVESLGGDFRPILSFLAVVREPITA